MNPTTPNTNANGFEDNVKKALRCADEVMHSVNASFAIAASTNVPTPEKNVNKLIDELDAAADWATQSALDQPTMEATGKEVQQIMSKGFDEFKRQTVRNMTYNEMRYAYG